MNESIVIRYSVQSVPTNGGGGGGGITPPIIIDPDNFELYRQGGNILCQGIPYCANSMTYDSMRRIFVPITLESYGDKIVAPSRGIYTVCNTGDRPTTLYLSVSGPVVTDVRGRNMALNTSDLVRIKPWNLTIDEGECADFAATVNYPSWSELIYEGSADVPFVIKVAGQGKTIEIPVRMSPPRPESATLIFDGFGMDILGAPLWLWAVGIFFLSVILLAFRSPQGEGEYL
jgi:hypothetical protein